MKDDIVTLRGTVSDIFAHRFVLATPTGRVLADLTPEGAKRIRLREGDDLEIVGEQKPSEVKVRRVAVGGGRSIEIAHEPPHGRHPPHPHEKVDPEAALRGARSNGYTPIAAPVRKPKHFEIIGRDQAGGLFELHVEFDGHIRKTRRVRARRSEMGGRDSRSGGREDRRSLTPRLTEPQHENPSHRRRSLRRALGFPTPCPSGAR